MNLSGVSIKRTGTMVTISGVEITSGADFFTTSLKKIKKQMVVTLDTENGITRKYFMWLAEKKAPDAKTIDEAFETINKLDAKEEIYIWDCLFAK